MGAQVPGSRVESIHVYQARIAKKTQGTNGESPWQFSSRRKSEKSDTKSDETGQKEKAHRPCQETICLQSSLCQRREGRSKARTQLKHEVKRLSRLPRQRGSSFCSCAQFL